VRRLLACGVGAVSALAFPFALDGVPLFDCAPRELLLLVGAAYLYRGRHAFFAGLGFFAVLLFWLVHTMHRYGGVHLAAALPAFALLVAYCAGWWALTPVLARRAATVVHPFVAFAAAVVTVDWLRSWVIGAFPWGSWAWAMVRDLPFVQVASLVGTYGVTALVAVAGAALADVRQRPRAAFAVLALIGAAHVYGATRTFEDTVTLRVAALQGNVPQDDKNRDLDNADAIHERYERGANRAKQQGAELMLWPETAWPARPAPDVTELPVQTSSLIGAVTLRFDERGDGQVTNSVFAVDDQGKVQGRYDKIVLVPFGEYVPLVASLGIDKLVKTLGAIIPGSSTQPLNGAGVLICYDGILPWIARQEVANGARFLTNQTNDAWYDGTSGPFQHRDIYVLRAIENDRWLVRAANTGISAVIDPLGRTRAQTRLGQEDVLVADIGLRETRTVYNRTGDLVLWIAVALITAGYGFTSLKRRSSSTASVEPSK
jgi:apolipoprotein N-acyltransferase